MSSRPPPKPSQTFVFDFSISPLDRSISYKISTAVRSGPHHNGRLSMQTIQFAIMFYSALNYVIWLDHEASGKDLSSKLKYNYNLAITTLEDLAPIQNVGET